ncbi:MAG: PEGA domain-containing protein [Phycisphaerales bacterium]
MKRAATAFTLLVAATALTGCRTRTLEITSDPPGALVWLNDEQVGRTPLETDFVHYGTYDVRLRMDGYVPLSTHRTATAPLADQPGIDFVTQAFPGRTVTSWHFTLEPLPELADRKGAEDAAYDRAKKVRDKATGVKTAAAQESGAAGTPATVTPSPTSPSTTEPAPTTDK